MRPPPASFSPWVFHRHLRLNISKLVKFLPRLFYRPMAPPVFLAHMPLVPTPETWELNSLPPPQPESFPSSPFPMAHALSRPTLFTQRTTCLFPGSAFHSPCGRQRHLCKVQVMTLPCSDPCQSFVSFQIKLKFNLP